MHKISGISFVELTEDDLKELIPSIGDSIVIRRLLKRICVLGIDPTFNLGEFSVTVIKTHGSESHGQVSSNACCKTYRHSILEPIRLSVQL